MNNSNNTFCVLPWIHLNNWPTGEAYPCCVYKMGDPVGDTTKQSISEIWQGDKMKDIRRRMLDGNPVDGCHKCYEKEQHHGVSLRQSMNKTFAHHIHNCTTDNPEPKLVYWDLRFSNLCNLRCRTCGLPFSSNWYDDHKKMFGDRNKKRILVSGRSENDLIDQLLEHIDYVEQIYFAGGEPLIMEQHYAILEELLKRNKLNITLMYNTNFTELTFKKTNVLDLWNKFPNVTVGASLDAMGPRAEYIRKNCDWDQIEQNRKTMIEKCPQVNFYVSSTVGVLNAWHISDFHYDWVEKKLITPQDFSVNLVQYPEHYKIDILPLSYKNQILEKWTRHLEWLEPLDQKTRATIGYKSAISLMMHQDNSHLLKEFWKITDQLDQIRNENCLEVLPELKMAINE